MTEDTHKHQISDDQPPKKGVGYLFSGLILGLILGLIFSLLVSPVKYQSADPSELTEADKQAYRLLIAQVYSATGDLDRALQRLALLKDENPMIELGAQAQRALANGNTEAARALALLGSAVQFGKTMPTIPPSVTNTPSSQIIPTQTLPELTPVP